MKLLYFTQFYKPEAIAASFRAFENAKIWTDDAHSVTIFTGYPNYPLGKIFEGYNPKLLLEEWDENIRVLRSKIIAKPNKTLISRLQSAFSGMFFGIVNIFFNYKKIGYKYDAVLGTSGIVSTALLGWIFASIHRIPFVFELRDITYRQLLATGKSSSSISVKLMRWMELFLSKRAKHVVVVTNGFKRILIDEGIASDKISVITNGVDTHPVQRTANSSSFILSYFGTLGISQNIIDTFPYATAIAKWCANLEYLIIGEGAQRTLIQGAIQKAEQLHIRLLHGMPMEELEFYYKQTSLSVITLRKSIDFQYTLPSKIFQIMGRGIAILYIGPEGEAAELIRKYNAGIVLCGTFDEDKQALEYFFSKPDWMETLRKMGENGVVAVEKNYSRKTLAREYMQLIQKCTKIAN